MKKRIVIPIIVLVTAIFLIFIGVIFTYQGETTSIIPTEKKTISDELFDRLKEQLSLEGYTFEYDRHEEDIYYFYQINNKTKEKELQITYNEATEEIETIDLVTTSDGQVEDDEYVDTEDDSVVE